MEDRLKTIHELDEAYKKKLNPAPQPQQQQPERQLSAQPAAQPVDPLPDLLKKLKIGNARWYFAKVEYNEVLECEVCKRRVNRDANASANMVTKALYLLSSLGLPHFFQRAKKPDN